MAAGRSEDDNGGGWWGGWIEAAKQKSAVALEQMKKDLGEFGSTIQRDTSTVVASSAGVIRDSMQTEANDSSASSRVKQGFSDLLSGLSESLAPKTSRTEEESHSESSKSSNHIFDRAKARLHAMQIDASTYCTQPEGRHHEEWLATFDTDQYKGDISDLLVANTDIRAMYTKLVPAVVSNADFWERYFYKVHQLNQDEARRTALKVRADMTSSQTFDEEELQWDDDDEEETPEAKNEGHEGRDVATSREDQDRIPSLPSAGNCAEEAAEKEPIQDNDDDDGQAPAASDETHSEQSPELRSAPPDCLNVEAATEQPKVESTDDSTTAAQLTATSPDEVGSTANETPLAEGEVSGGKEGTANTERVDADDGTADECFDEDSPDRGDVRDRPMTSDPLVISVPAQQADADERADKKPSPSGSDASNKDSSLSDDWERDFDDIDVTEEDLEAAAHKTKTRPTDGNEDEDLDDWENWE